MQATLHPEFPQENAHLDDTLEVVNKHVEENARFGQKRDDGWGGILQLGADARSSIALRRHSSARAEHWLQAQREPFFARVDWIERTTGTTCTIYIGKQEVYSANVYSWAAPLPGELYYAGTALRGQRQRLLKRTFGISASKLNDITDNEVDPSRGFLMGLVGAAPSLLQEEQSAESWMEDAISSPESAAEQAIGYSDSLLTTLLTASRDSGMRDIVMSIQEQQYRIISSSAKEVLIVQGVPGSGKTAIALHRLPFLLFVNRDDEHYVPDTLLFLGPSNLFLGYIAPVLPALGESQIPQMTFDAWLLEQLGEQVDFQSQENSLEFLLNDDVPDQLRRAYFDQERLKGSVNMARLLDRYVGHLFQDLLAHAGPIECTYGPMIERQGRVQPLFQYELSAQDIRDVLESNKSYAYNERIDRAITSLGNRARHQFDRAHPDADSDSRFRKFGPFNSAVHKQIDAHFEPWRQTTTVQAYRRLIATRALLHELGQNIFSERELDALYQEPTSTSTQFSYSDLPALTYLHILLDGAKTGTRYRHVVVDEAQDLTPLHLVALKQCAADSSFTIVGDRAQWIFPQYGFSTWNEVGELLQGQGEADSVATTGSLPGIHLENIRESYRSTREIVEFCNDLLERTGYPSSLLARPVLRSGPKPVLKAFKTGSDRALFIQKTIEAEVQQDHHSIGIICKTLAACHQLQHEWAAVSPSPLPFITDRKHPYSGGIVLMPGYLTKGLEFDVVIVGDADAQSYQAEELDLRLLYVSLSRAAHSLYISWIGSQTELLDAKQQQLKIRRIYTPYDEVDVDTSEVQIVDDDRDPAAIGIEVKDINEQITNVRVSAVAAIETSLLQKTPVPVDAPRTSLHNGFHEGACYHIVHFGYERNTITSSEQEKAIFIHSLRKHFRPDLTEILAYCLMPDHYHLLVKLKVTEFESAILRPFIASYTAEVNKVRSTTSPFLQSDFMYKLVEDQNAVKDLTCFIHLNPVSAQLISRPEEWKFSSYQDYLGLRQGTLPTIDSVLSAFQTREAYRDFVLGNQSKDWRPIADYLLDAELYPPLAEPR